MNDIVKSFQDFIKSFDEPDVNHAANAAFILKISKEYAAEKEKLFTLEQVWDAVWKATEGLAITYDRHDLADSVCDKLDEVNK